MSTIQQVTAADWKQLGRSERRQGVRRAMARLELLQSRCRVLENQSRDLNGRVDRAADAHARTCGPLQERLARIEEEMAVHLADRTPVPSELEAERVQLLNEIADANICLERETEIVRKQQNKLESERHELSGNSAELLMLRRELTINLADPKLALELFCSQQAILWCEQRLRAAQEQVKNWEHDLQQVQRSAHETTINSSGREVRRRLDQSDLQRCQILENRLLRWRAELAAAGDALSEARAKSDVIFQQIENE